MGDILQLLAYKEIFLDPFKSIQYFRSHRNLDVYEQFEKLLMVRDNNSNWLSIPWFLQKGRKTNFFPLKGTDFSLPEDLEINAVKAEIGRVCWNTRLEQPESDANIRAISTIERAAGEGV